MISIIIPTFTGEDTIDQALDSVANQCPTGSEVIVVIDGPNTMLRQKVDLQKEKFNKKNIKFIIHQFSKNKGRFVARRRGAELAKNDYLLFYDDRVTIPNGFINSILSLNKEILMPDVHENSAPTPISRFLQLLRKRIYKPIKHGYAMTQENFEASAKGTGCLMVKKKLFLDACKEMLKNKDHDADLRNVSDDTLLLKMLIKLNKSIYKSTLTVNYSPRIGFFKEIKHVYERGPKFIDYYLKPGTRYFIPLLLTLIGAPLLLVFLVFHTNFVPYIVFLSLFLLLLVMFYLAPKPKEFALVIVGCLTSIIAFGAGIFKGLILKVVR